MLHNHNKNWGFSDRLYFFKFDTFFFYLMDVGQIEKGSSFYLRDRDDMLLIKSVWRRSLELTLVERVGTVLQRLFAFALWGRTRSKRSRHGHFCLNKRQTFGLQTKMAKVKTLDSVSMTSMAYAASFRQPIV